MKRLLLFFLICLVCTACGTEKSPESQLDPESEQVSKDVGSDLTDFKQMATTNNSLGFHMIKQVEPDATGNIFISPTSLLMATLMVYNGADGTTKDEMDHALQLKDATVDKLNKKNASFLSMLDKDTNHIDLQLANSIWVSDVFHLQDTYKDVNKKYLHADVHSMDVSKDESAHDINKWVQKTTQGNITDIVEPPIDPETVAILLNAIYFKGDWTYPFNPNETMDQPFYPDDGNPFDVKMMNIHSDKLPYMENDLFQAVSLPYGDKEMSMGIFLPKKKGLDTFIKELTMDNWHDWQNEFRRKEGTVQLPRFELQYETNLKQTLKNLGIQTAFTEDAEFPNMIQGNDPLMINKIKQKTFIKVDETGTEAAGETSTEMQTTSASIEKPFSMTMDKPFFLAITDDETDAILFMGKVTNPVE